MSAEPPGGGPAGPPPGPSVVLYGRPGCHLCDDARAVVHEVRRRVAFVLQEVDIESDDELFKRYLELIPVLEIEGVKAFELFVDSQQLERALQEAASVATPKYSGMPDGL
jgi:Glutaredoxin-like domain (DUF836)